MQTPSSRRVSPGHRPLDARADGRAAKSTCPEDHLHPPRSASPRESSRRRTRRRPRLPNPGPRRSPRRRPRRQFSPAPPPPPRRQISAAGSPLCRPAPPIAAQILVSRPASPAGPPFAAAPPGISLTLSRAMTHDLRFPARSYDFTSYVPCHNWIGGEWTPVRRRRQPADRQPASRQVVRPGHHVRRGRRAPRRRRPPRPPSPAGATPRSRSASRSSSASRPCSSATSRSSAWLVSHENGKVFAEARADVLKGIECVEYGAQPARTWSPASSST